MAAKESDQWQSASRSNGDEMTQVKSESFAFTVYHEGLENKSEQLSEVVISEENERLRFLESHLKNTKLNYEDEIITHTFIHKAERIFEEVREDKEKKGTNEINKESHEIVCKFFMKGTCKFGDQCFNSHNFIPTECNGDEVELSKNILVPMDGNADGNCNPNSKPSKQKNNNITVSEKLPKKKVPMKTATDVINRIQWDEKLHPEDFVIGYLDRFLGVIENSFSSFDWEDVTSVDPSILSIPRHRIQYFKYHDEIVWDKNKRLDCVFGSTGSGQTILDFIEMFEN